MAKNLLFLIVGGVTLTLFMGCSGGAEGGKKLKVYPVKGKITLGGGAPVAKAFVAFNPVDEKNGRVAYDTTDDDGNFELTTYDASDGAAEGDYVVVVSKSALSATGNEYDYDAAHNAANQGQSAPASHGSGKASADLALPAKYADKSQTDLKATVSSSGENNFTFDLKP